MTDNQERPYVDPDHILPDEEWAKVVRRAREIREETAAQAQGGAASGIAPVLDMTAAGIRSGKYFPMSGIPTQLLVLHSAECPLQGGYARSLTEWAATVYPAAPIASWQRFVDPLVRLRFIPDELGAWHASEANVNSIGWEQAGYARFSREEWLTPDGRTQIESLAFDMAEVAVRDGIPARWLSNAEVVAATQGGNRSIKGFCTHRQIDPETRTDPGNGYPYDLLMERIKFYMGGGTVEENDMTADMPMTSKDGYAVTLQDVLNSVDAKAEAAQVAVKDLPAFIVNVSGEFDILRADRAAKNAQIAALTDAVKALATSAPGVDPEAILDAIEAGMDKFRDTYAVTLQRVPAVES